MMTYNVIHSNLLCFIGLALVISMAYRMLKTSRLRQSWLLLANICFYSIGVGIGWTILMLAVGLWSFFTAQRIAQGDKPRFWLMIGVIPVALSLISLKYAHAVCFLLADELPASIAQLIIPLGMSYYVLKAISYLVDVYHQYVDDEPKNKSTILAQNNYTIVDYLAYLTFFGQIIAGPIQRFSQWQASLTTIDGKSVKNSSMQDYATAYYPIVLGLLMKLVIAHRIGPFVMQTIAACDTANGLQLWLGWILYAVYIYCDFAGYSLIAIGVTRCFGIVCPDNFKSPYLSMSIREFWQRWHITLSTWLRDYIYIPLGGNRKGKVRRTINVIITFLISGLWHGSTLNFLVWGLYHGLLNAIYPKLPSAERLTIKNVSHILITFLLVSFGWLIFATPDLHTFGCYISGMFTRMSISMPSIQSAILPFTGDNQCLSHFLVVTGFILVLTLYECNRHFGWIKVTARKSLIWQVFVLTSLLLFGAFGNVSFIYAGF